MGNALNDILGFGAKAADAVLLGGAVGKAQRSNALADFVQQGDYASAQDLALRNGRPDLAQNFGQQAQQQQAGKQKTQDDENSIFSGLSIALSEISDPNARRMAFEAMKPGLSQRYGLDDQDFAQVPLDDQNALRLFGQQFIAPETQASQLLTRQSQAETGRSNMAGERLRGGELGVAQGNLALNRDKFSEDSRQFDQRLEVDRQAASQPGGGAKITEGERKFATFGRLADNAHQAINTIEAKQGFNPSLVQSGKANINRNADGQAYSAAKRTFIDAIIRPMTGAAVTQFEFDSAESRYFPKFGDDKKTIEFKRQLRQDAIDAIKDGAGGAYEAINGATVSTPQMTPGGGDVNALLQKYGVE